MRKRRKRGESRLFFECLGGLAVWGVGGREGKEVSGLSRGGVRGRLWREKRKKKEKGRNLAVALRKGGRFGYDMRGGEERRESKRGGGGPVPRCCGGRKRKEKGSVILASKRAWEPRGRGPAKGKGGGFSKVRGESALLGGDLLLLLGQFFFFTVGQGRGALSKGLLLGRCQFFHFSKRRSINGESDFLKRSGLKIDKVRASFFLLFVGGGVGGGEKEKRFPLLSLRKKKTWMSPPPHKNKNTKKPGKKTPPSLFGGSKREEKKRRGFFLYSPNFLNGGETSSPSLIRKRIRLGERCWGVTVLDFAERGGRKKGISTFFYSVPRREKRGASLR